MGTEQPNLSPTFDSIAVLENLGNGVLIFNAEHQLVHDNRVARQILGTNMVVLRQKGWAALAMLINRDLPEEISADELRAKALRQTSPVRFQLMLGNAYIPCWLSAVHQENETPLTLVSIEQPDWTPIRQFLQHLDKEGMPAVEDTLGHASFMIQIAKRANDATKVTQIAGQMQRFATLIQEEMTNFEHLVRQLQRLERIQTGQIGKNVKQRVKAINLEEFFEDFMEELSEEQTKQGEEKDLRDRFTFDIPDDLSVNLSQPHFETIMRDVLDNAMRYSKSDTPVVITAFSTNQGKSIQINITDEGYGIRDNDHDRVFAVFKRGRQPQVIAQGGHGLSLALCKAELEAMGGRIWFISDDGVGTTFSLKLPAQQADTSAEATSTDEKVEPSDAS